MRRWLVDRSVVVAMGAAVTLVLAGCSAGVDSESLRDLGIETEVVVEPAEEWVETISTRSSRRSQSRAISRDGKWLATAWGEDVCIHSLAEDVEPVCVSEPTIGSDSLSWNRQSSMVVMGGSASGRWNSTGIWTLATDGTLSAVVPVEEVNLLRDEGGQMHMGMAFRPDGNSIVFSHWTPDTTGLAEIGLDGTDRIELRDLGDRHFAILPHLPLVDGRVLVNDDQIQEGGVDLLDNGRATRLIESGNSDNFEPVPWAVAASTTVDGFGNGVVLVVGWRAGGRGLEKNDWWLVDFDGNQYRLETPENENVLSATLSPDGNYVAYITFDQFSLPAVFELHVIELSAVVAGGEPVGSHVLTSEGVDSLRQMDGLLSSRTMRWTYDNRMLIVLADADAPVLQIDLNPSAR